MRLDKRGQRCGVHCSCSCWWPCPPSAGRRQRRWPAAHRAPLQPVLASKPTSTATAPTTSRSGFPASPSAASSAPGRSTSCSAPRGGLSGAGSQLFTQDTAGVGSTAEEFDNFGAALAVGNFNGDDFDDLAVGVPGESRRDLCRARVRSTSCSVRPAASPVPVASCSIRTSRALASTAEEFDFFGSALAAGDLDGDGSRRPGGWGTERGRGNR